MKIKALNGKHIFHLRKYHLSSSVHNATLIFSLFHVTYVSDYYHCIYLEYNSPCNHFNSDKKPSFYRKNNCFTL